MASLSLSLCGTARPVQSINLGFHRIPSYRPHSSSLNRNVAAIFRFRNAVTLMTSRRLLSVHASSKPSEEPSGKTEAITNGDTSTAQGPPFLTILAGIVVFAFILWAIGSILSWLIGLLASVFSK